MNTRSHRQALAAAAIIAALGATLHPALAQLSKFKVEVPSKDDVFAAGLSSDPAGGQVPAPIALPPGTLCVKVAKVTGTLTQCTLPEGCITLDNDRNYNDASGTGGQNKQTANLGMGSISGLTGPGEGYLVGVFTQNTVGGAPPVALVFGKRRSDSLSPLLNQSFFVGDGHVKDGVGRRVNFTVPAGATELYFGISDSCYYGSHDPHTPGCYYDNVGSFEVHVTTSPDSCPLAG
jgi:hypothetical protein